MVVGHGGRWVWVVRAYGALHLGEKPLHLCQGLDLAHVEVFRRLQGFHIQQEHHLPESGDAEVALQDAVDVASAPRVGKGGELPLLPRGNALQQLTIDHT